MQPIDLLNKYKDIYVPSFIVHPYKKNDVRSIVLTEKDKSTKLKEIAINNVPDDTILLNLHQYSALNLGEKLKIILDDAPGIFKCCDYLLISVLKGKAYLIFIEMKTNLKVKSIDYGVVRKQFRGASCFIEYCNAIIEHFYNMPSIRSLELNLRYVLIAGAKLNKQPTRRAYSKHVSPETFLKLNVDVNMPLVEFGKLLN